MAPTSPAPASTGSRPLRVLIFGATGMVGQGVLRECLLDPDVVAVQTVGRSASGGAHPKLTELVHADLWNYTAIEDRLADFDACFFCLGVSSAGRAERDYAHLTYDLTLAAATTLARLNPAMTFIYVSGAHTDSSETGPTMWARVKGRTENALLRLPFRRAFMLRPGVIRPLHGARSKTRSYRVIYAVAAPLLPLLQRLFPRHITTTEQIGRVMLALVKKPAAKAILEVSDLTSIA